MMTSNTRAIVGSSKRLFAFKYNVQTLMSDLIGRYSMFLQLTGRIKASRCVFAMCNSSTHRSNNVAVEVTYLDHYRAAVINLSTSNNVKTIVQFDLLLRTLLFQRCGLTRRTPICSQVCFCRRKEHWVEHSAFSTSATWNKDM